MTYTDYYPYGWTLPGRTAGTTYRYGFQGEFAEKDPETGWNAFELRMYDSRIARWSTIDPYEEFWSPYVSMGNNPSLMIDPDGGSVANWIANIFVQLGTWGKQSIDVRSGQPYIHTKGWGDLGLGKLFQSGWQDFYKSDLHDYARELGYNNTQIGNTTLMGDLFESIFNYWYIGKNPASAAYYNFQWNREKFTDGGARNTVPDFTADYTYNKRVGSKTVRVRKGVIWEVKAADPGTELTRSSYDGQIGGHIDNLAARNQRHIGLARSWFFYNNVPLPSVNFITTAGVGVSNSLRNHARDKGIHVAHYIAQHRIKNGVWEFHFR